MFYSVPLTLSADAVLFELGVRQLAAQIPFEGGAQRGAAWRSVTLSKYFDTDES
jgi:hypothetical protein